MIFATRHSLTRQNQSAKWVFTLVFYKPQIAVTEQTVQSCFVKYLQNMTLYPILTSQSNGMSFEKCWIKTDSYIFKKKKDQLTLFLKL